MPELPGDSFLSSRVSRKSAKVSSLTRKALAAPVVDWARMVWSSRVKEAAEIGCQWASEVESKSGTA